MNKDLINEILEKSKSTKSLICIWVYSDDDGFWSGYVTDYNDEYVQIKHYTKYGKPDGIIIEQISNIETIDFEDDYSKCLRYLIDNSDRLDEEDELNYDIPSKENWQFEFLNDFIGNTDRIFRITILEDNNHSGFVSKISEESVVFQLIGKLGEDEGFSVFKLSDISRIRLNDIENRKKLLLYNWKKNQ